MTPGPLHARITLDLADQVGPVPPRLFGSFVEHLGRAVTTGIHEPGHPTSDEQGFRGDVLDLTRELGVTVVRYPGGNFVSSYRWEDGVGPVEERPARLAPAWHTVEDNSVGLHEFVHWARTAGVEVMYAVNLGTRGIQEAADVLEYANHPSGTTLSDRRRANGDAEPFDITLWCLGNEMDGPWQVGHKTADEYGRLAAETARLMRMVDRRVELVVAGSSGEGMPTFGDWERTVLRHTDGLVDHVSVHAYVQERDGDVAGFLASAVPFERYVTRVAEIMDEVGAKRPDGRPLGIAVDEWNVWDLTDWNAVDDPEMVDVGGRQRPRQLEQIYDVADAVVVGSLLGVLLRQCDRVTVANLAQLVNVIAPIMTEPGGAAWKQTTFAPFATVAGTVGGTSLRPRVESDDIDTVAHGAVAAVDAAAVLGEDGSVTTFLTNRSPDHAVEMDLVVQGLPTGAGSRLAVAVLTAPNGGDRRTVNDAAGQPVELRDLADVAWDVYAAGNGNGRVTLPPMSWTRLVLTGADQKGGTGQPPLHV